jgi:hypothetical protein
MFVNRNYFILFNNIFKKSQNTIKFKRRHSEFEQGCVLSESYKATDALPPIFPACRQPLLPACMFITRDTVRHPSLFCLENLFVNRFVHDERRSWTEVPPYFSFQLSLSFCQCPILPHSSPTAYNCSNWQCMQVHIVKRTSTPNVTNFPLTLAVNLHPMKICLSRISLATSMSSFDLKRTRITKSPLCRGSILWESTPNVVFNSCFKSYQKQNKTITKNKTTRVNR